MLQNAYFLAKIGADTAENEQHLPKFSEIATLMRSPRGGGPREHRVLDVELHDLRFLDKKHAEEVATPLGRVGLKSMESVSERFFSLLLPSHAERSSQEGNST